MSLTCYLTWLSYVHLFEPVRTCARFKLGVDISHPGRTLEVVTGENFLLQTTFEFGNYRPYPGVAPEEIGRNSKAVTLIMTLFALTSFCYLHQVPS